MQAPRLQLARFCLLLEDNACLGGVQSCRIQQLCSALHLHLRFSLLLVISSVALRSCMSTEVDTLLCDLAETETF